MNGSSPTAPPAEVRCAECGTTLPEGQDRVSTGERTFCRPCYGNLTAQLRQVIELQGSDINYPMALAGALAGAAAGAAVWWGFTVATNVAFGLVAVVIGFAVGKGTVLAAAGKRARGLQVLAASVAVIAYVYATYLVDRTFILQAMAQQGQLDSTLPWFPDAGLLYQVIRAGFRPFDLVFLAIVIYQAWRMPAPLKLVARG